MKKVMRWIWCRLYPPTPVQKKAAGQVLLSFGAASAISLVTILFGSPDGGAGYTEIQKIVALAIAGFAFFVVGLILHREDDSKDAGDKED